MKQKVYYYLYQTYNLDFPEFLTPTKSPSYYGYDKLPTNKFNKLTKEKNLENHSQSPIEIQSQILDLVQTAENLVDTKTKEFTSNKKYLNLNPQVEDSSIYLAEIKTERGYEDYSSPDSYDSEVGLVVELLLSRLETDKEEKARLEKKEKEKEALKKQAERLEKELKKLNKRIKKETIDG